MKYNPHDYQIYAINFIKEHPIAAILLDMGMRRTLDFRFLRSSIRCWSSCMTEVRRKTKWMVRNNGIHEQFYGGL